VQPRTTTFAQPAPSLTRGPLQELGVAIDLAHELVDALPRDRHRLDDGHLPTLLGIGVPRDQGHHVLEAALEVVHALFVGLVDQEHVGDLHDASLDGLDIVAQAGHQHHHGGVCQPHHVHLALAPLARDRTVGPQVRTPHQRNRGQTRV
jgi:hypothetical protein